MTRHSTRIAAKSNPEASGSRLPAAEDLYSRIEDVSDGGYEDNDIDFDDGEFIAKKKPKKKSRQHHQSAAGDQPVMIRRGGRGKLKDLPDMPMDILFEIFGHLQPIDILRLARTTKALREILMRRSTMFVWKRARANEVGIPDCPDDLSEPQYVNFLFMTYCHYCLDPHAPYVSWHARVRCCKQCGTEKFNDDAYSLNVNYIQAAPDIYRILDIVPFIAPQPIRGRSRRYEPRRFSVEVSDAYSQEYIKLVNDSEKSAWLSSKREEFSKRSEHARSCELWSMKKASDRASELKSARERRKTAIYDRLTQLGWGEELAKLPNRPNPLDKHKLVNQPKDLTDRIWGNIGDALITFMEETQARRVDREKVRMREECTLRLVHLHRDYVESQPLNAIIPGLADVANSDQFKTSLANMPLGKPILASDLEDFTNSLPRIVEHWRKEKDLELLGLIQNCDPSRTDAALDLATTLFKCKQCSSPIAYPRILVHQCATTYQYKWGGEEMSDIYQYLRCCPWNFDGSRVTFDNKFSEAAKVLLRSCNLEPDTATSKDISDKFFECLQCTNDEGRLAMRWMNAVTHHSNHEEPRWAILNQDDTITASRVENSEETKRLTSGNLYGLMRGSSAVCVHCNAKVDCSIIKNHFNYSHCIVNPVYREDFVFHIDTSINDTARPVRISKP